MRALIKESVMTTPKPGAAATAATEKVLAQKWGKTAIAAGFTALPNVVFLHAKALELKNTDVLVLLHLASYWWKPGDDPWPSKAKLAAALDLDPRTVQRSVQRMEKLGYVERIARKADVGDNLSNKYSLRGLVKAIEKIAKQEIAEREKREAESQQRKRTPKAFSLIKGGKDDDE